MDKNITTNEMKAASLPHFVQEREARKGGVQAQGATNVPLPDTFQLYGEQQLPEFPIRQ